MQKLTRAALAGAFLLAFGANAQAAGELVLGDSLGVGVKMASGRTGPARLSVFIRNDHAISQINTVPAGATAFLVLGTNDSAGSVKGLEKFVDNIVAAADKRNVKLIWIGPPCVRKAWDKNSRELDAMLAVRLAKTSVKYVSIRSDALLCSGKEQGGDGVHMTFKGYQYMWNMARVVAGLPEEPGAKIQVAAAPKPAGTDPAAPRAKRVRVASADPSVPAPAAAHAPKQKRVASRPVQARSASAGLFDFLFRGRN